MSRFSFIECCQFLAVDPKTLRQWLIQAAISLHPHPKDARIKCLTSEQLQMLARLHGRVLQDPAEATLQLEETPSKAPPPCSDADLRARVAQLEAQVVTLHTHLTDLALQLLRARQYPTEQQVLAGPAQTSMDKGTFASQAGSTLSGALPSAPPPFVCHPAEKRTPLVLLIEYGAAGRYVLICPTQGELLITPDSPEWFAWLASLTSFRFMGRSGRFSARRGYNRRPNRSWYAQRGIHQKNYSKYIGVSEHITTERLEQVAASFQAYLP